MIGAMTTIRWILILLAALVVIAIAAALVGRALVRRGLREPLAVRAVNRASDRVVDSIKHPVTIAVLDEVADVLREGRYTRNIASALEENRSELSAMISEKVLTDRAAARSIGLLPFRERLVHEVVEASLRVVFEVLADPRTDELISDLLRDNLTQLREAVRARGQ